MKAKTSRLAIDRPLASRTPTIVIEAKKDARHATNSILQEHWPAFVNTLKLGYIDPAETFATLSPEEQRAVLYLAYYGALRIP